jgi:hypothetical protein
MNRHTGVPGIDYDLTLNRRWSRANRRLNMCNNPPTPAERRSFWAKANWYADDQTRRHRNNYPQAYND